MSEDYNSLWLYPFNSFGTKIYIIEAYLPAQHFSSASSRPYFPSLNKKVWSEGSTSQNLHWIY